MPAQPPTPRDAQVQPTSGAPRDLMSKTELSMKSNPLLSTWPADRRRNKYLYRTTHSCVHLCSRRLADVLDDLLHHHDDFACGGIGRLLWVHVCTDGLWFRKRKYARLDFKIQSRNRQDEVDQCVCSRGQIQRARRAFKSIDTTNTNEQENY